MRSPFFPAQRRVSPFGNQDGFVLVAILMLIALSLVLIVTTSSISQMERKAVSNSTKEEIAKRNALFALEVALAQLQKEAGPDQRVTATADILNTNTNVAQPFWTGVWKTFNPAWTNDAARVPWCRPQPLDIQMPGQQTPILRDWSTNATNVVWLVSGATNNTEINPLTFGASGTNSNNVAVMAVGWGTNSNTISVPLVTINAPGAKVSATNPSPGRYAYWISDEGVKAKVTLTDTNMRTWKSTPNQGMVVSSLLHFTAPSANNIASILTNFGITGITDFRNNSNLPILTSLNGLSFLSNNIPFVTNNLLSADLTVNGFGIICDVRRGGLKQDLTAAMESSTSNSVAYTQLLLRSGSQKGSLNNNDALMAYRAANIGLPENLNAINQGNNSIPDGLRWQSLYNFYNLYKKRLPQNPSIASITSTAKIPPYGVGSPSTITNNIIETRGPFYDDPVGSKLSYGMMTPNIILDSEIVTLGAVKTNVPVGTNSVTKYFFKVSHYPLIVMNNPYSVGLDVGNSAFCVTKNLGQKVSLKVTCKMQGTNNYYTANNNYNPNDSTNLWPAASVLDTNTGISTWTNPYVIQGNPYAFTLAVTNPSGTVMAPGEIRVYGYETGLGANANKEYVTNNLTNFSVFAPNAITNYSRILTATNTFIYDTQQGQGGVSVILTNWDGSTNPLDTVSISYPGSSVSVVYNTYHFSPQGLWNGGTGFPFTISTWPATNAVVDFPGSLIGTGNYQANYTTTNQSIEIGKLVDNPITVLSVTERLKGTIPATTYTTFLGQGSNYPIFMGNSLYLNSSRSGAGLGGTTNVATETDVKIVTAPSVQITTNLVTKNSCTVSWLTQSVGDATPISSKTNNNNVTLVTRDVPFSPLVSIGQFMHFEDYYINTSAGSGSQNLFPVSLPLMSIGGSLCCPETAPSVNAIFYNGNGTNDQWHLLADHSFLANETLFDTYFFSTVPPINGFKWGSTLDGTNPFAFTIDSNTISNKQPLPNGRFVYYMKNGTNPNVSDLQDEGKASSCLLVNGAFNVNSTSVIAWKALLTSLSGQDFLIYNYTEGKMENRSGITNPILRFWDIGRFDPNVPWDGMRSLTDKQVTALANEIVNQVRKRGPFLSMGDFLNRRLLRVGASPDTNNVNIMGALQAAIENTQTNGQSSDVNINIHTNTSIGVNVQSYTYVNTGTGRNGAGPPFPTVGYNKQISINKIVTNTATGIPGYLMQQDLIQSFAPVMTVRSDTFMIRVYGEADRKTTSSAKTLIPEARAWGEAVVQRLPDYVDQTDPALIASSNVPGMSVVLGDATPVYGKNGPIVNKINESLGRRFRVVSFRWLNQSDL